MEKEDTSEKGVTNYTIDSTSYKSNHAAFTRLVGVFY